MKYTLAIDQGTHASRAGLFDESGALVDVCSKAISLDRLSDTHIEQDADEIIQSVRYVTDTLVSSVSEPDTIVACGFASQRSSVLAWTPKGTAVSPVLSWQDTRGASQLCELRQHEGRIQRISGLPLSAHYGASKLHSLLVQSSQHKDLRLSPVASYVLFHLLKEQPYIVDHANAQRTQLFSLAELDWSRQLAELFEVPVSALPMCVPILSDTKQAHGHLTESDIPLTAISGDQNAAIYSDAELDTDTALINIGSGAFILRPLGQYADSDSLLTGIRCSDSHSVQYLREATVNGAGSALTWLEDNHGVSDLWQQLPVWLDEIARPPVFLNTIGGLGSPWWRNDIGAVFLPCDNSQATLAAEAVAVIESIVFMLTVNLTLMQSEQPLNRLHISGGLSQLDGLCQRLSDLSRLPVQRTEQTESTSRGIARLAAGRPEQWCRQRTESFQPASSLPLEKRYQYFCENLKRP